MVGAEHVVSNVEFAEVQQDTHAIYRRQTYMCCSALQCSVLQCSVLQCIVMCYSVLRCVESAEVQQDTHAIYRRQTYISVLQCLAVCCGVRCSATPTLSTNVRPEDRFLL